MAKNKRNRIRTAEKRINPSFSLVIILLIVFFFAFLAGSAQATNWHIRTDGNDNCNGLYNNAGASGNCAFRHIQNGVNTAQAGDMVIVHSGDYTSQNPSLTSARSGTSSQPIIIEAASGETAIISRATVTHNYNTIKGFVVTRSGNYAASGIQLNGHYNHALYNMIVGNCRADSGICSGIGVSGNYNNISYNTLDGKNNGADTSFTWGMHISGSHNEITYNTIQDTNSIERVFELYGASNHIANNEVRNIKWTIGDGSHPDIFQCFGTGPSYNHIIENNYMHDMEGQVGNLEGDPSNFHDWIFRNNIFANIKMEFFIHIAGMKFYNNIFYRVTTTNTGIPLYAAYPGGSVTPVNNAFIDCGTGSNNGWYNGETGADYNFVSDTATGGTKSGFKEAHGINGGNPQLIAYFNDCSANACDFHVGADSVLIDRGSVISGYTLDKDGITRPQGPAWDIGAYEYGGTAQTCAQQGGICCAAQQTCSGSSKSASDCAICCIGTCQAQLVCIAGDLNCDKKVDIFDLVLVAQNYAKTSGFDAKADVNKDGKIDIFDLVVVAQNYGKTG